MRLITLFLILATLTWRDEAATNTSESLPELGTNATNATNVNATEPGPRANDTNATETTPGPGVNTTNTTEPSLGPGVNATNATDPSPSPGPGGNATNATNTSTEPSPLPVLGENATNATNTSTDAEPLPGLGGNDTNSTEPSPRPGSNATNATEPSPSPEPWGNATNATNTITEPSPRPGSNATNGTEPSSGRANATEPSEPSASVNVTEPSPLSGPGENATNTTTETLPGLGRNAANATEISRVVEPKGNATNFTKLGDDIRNLTEDFIKGVKRLELEKFFGEKTTVNMDGLLCPGSYQGLRELKLHCGNQFEVASLEGKSVIVDQREGKSMVFFNISGVMQETGGKFNATYACLLEWGSNETLSSGSCWPVKQESAPERMPKILKWLKNATKLESQHGVSCANLSIDHPIMDLISDEFLLNIFTSPPDFFNQSSWSGKQGMVDACKVITEKETSFAETSELGRSLLAEETSFAETSKLGRSLLATNDTDVWILSGQEILTHLHINGDALLTKADVYILQVLSEYGDLEGSEAGRSPSPPSLPSPPLKVYSAADGDTDVGSRKVASVGARRLVNYFHLREKIKGVAGTRSLFIPLI